MSGFRSHFDLDPALIYLNSGTLSLCPRAVMRAQKRYMDEAEANPTATLVGVAAQLWERQQQLAQFFGARPEDMFLRHNVTAVLNELILGAPLARGRATRGEILVTDLEYGAIVHVCRMRAEREGWSVRTIKVPQACTSSEEVAAAMIKEFRDETRMFLLSHVTSPTGHLFPIGEVARATRAQGITLVVDGAHAPGATNLNFSELEDVDFYGGNLHKWMLGPKCTAFGWVPKRNQEKLKNITASWTTYSAATPLDQFGGGSRFAERYMLPACQNFAPFFAIREMLQFWQELGTEPIRHRLVELQTCVENLVSKQLGWKPLFPALSSGMRGPLLTYELPPALEAQGYSLMQRLLVQHGVQIALPRVPNGGDAGEERFAIRFSPHIYNEVWEIEKAIAALQM